MSDWKKVKRLYEQGVPIRQIAREVGVSRNTVRRWIRLEEEPTYKREKRYPTKIDEYKEDIKKWYLENGYIGSRIHKELEKRGYEGSPNPIYRYLKKLREERSDKFNK